MRKHRFKIKAIKRAMMSFAVFCLSMLMVLTSFTMGISANDDEVYTNDDMSVVIKVDRTLDKESKELKLDLTVSNEETVTVDDIQIEGQSIKNDDFLYSHAVGKNDNYKFSVITTRIEQIKNDNDEMEELVRQETFIFTVSVNEIEDVKEDSKTEPQIQVDNSLETDVSEELLDPSEVIETDKDINVSTLPQDSKDTGSEVVDEKEPIPDGTVVRQLDRIPDKDEIDTVLADDEYILYDEESRTVNVIKDSQRTQNATRQKRATTGNVTKGEILSTGISFYWKANPSYQWDYPGGFSEIFVDGKVSYCIEPSVMNINASNATGTSFDSLGQIRVMDGRLYTTLTAEQKLKMEHASNYGYSYPGHQTKAFKWATQVKVAEIVGWGFYSYGSTDISYELPEIERLMASHEDRPSWHGEQRDVKLGEIVELSNSLNTDFVIYSHDGLEIIEDSGTSLKVKVVAKNATLIMDKKQGNPNGTTYVYSDGATQRVASFTLGDPVSTIIDFKVKSHEQRIRKLGENGEPLANHKFRMSYSNAVDANGLLADGWDYVTGADGYTPYASWNNEGTTVYVQEIEAKNPYILNKEIKTFVVEAGAETTLIFTNKKALGQIGILKLDDHGNPLANVKFNILNVSNTIVGTLTTGADGRALSSTLPLGNYKLQEVSVPIGIVLSEELTNVEIAYANQTTEVVLVSKTINNKYQRGDLTFTKVENNWDKLFPQYNGIKLSGATVELFAKNDIYEGSQRIYRANELIGTEVTNSAGQVTFHNLPLGDYYAKEKVSPVGYVLFQGQWDASIKYDGQNITTEITQTGVTITNQVIYGKASLMKTNGGRELLSGAVFGVFTKDGQLITKLTTNIFGTITTPNLRYGDYYFQELEAPIGYWLDDTKIPFTISEHESMQYVTAPNKLIEAKLLVHKVDSETLVPLAGVGFKILDSNNEVVTIKFQDGKHIIEKNEWITDEDGEFLLEAYLPYGEYTLIESITLEGYNPIDPIKFTIDENQNYINLEIIGSVLDLGQIGNTKIYGDLLIKKISAETGLPLAFTEFDVFNDQMDYVGSVITDENGEARLDHLVYGQYHVLEKAVPFPHVIHPDKAMQSVFISEEGKFYELVFENQATSISIYKIDKETDLPIPNTIFDLYDGDMNFLETVTTDENGFAKVEGYDFGTYFVEEMEVPFPYVINPENKLQELVLSEENNHYEITFENVKTSITIFKGDKDGNPIPNTVFDLYDGDKNFLETVTTDENGIAVVEGYDFGTYFVEEMKVPFPYVINPENKLQELKLTETNNHYTIEFKNEKAVGEYHIRKLDAKTQAPIANVSYGIYDVTDLELVEGQEFSYKDVQSLKAHVIGLTDIDGRLVFNDLDIERKWAVIELETPYGYIVDETVRLVEFEYVDNNTPVIKEEATLLNERLQVTIKGVKIDSVTKSQIISQYFDLVLRDKDGNIMPLDHKDENGVHYWVVDALEFYFMNEEKAPIGYMLSSEVIDVNTFEEMEDHLYIIEFPNDEEPVELPKTGLADSPFVAIGFLILALGVELLILSDRSKARKLKELNKKSVFRIVNKDGKVLFDNLSFDDNGRIDLGVVEHDETLYFEKSEVVENSPQNKTQESKNEKKDKLE